MTYAVIEFGGKQYKVSAGDKILVEKFENTGEYKFDKVLLVGSDTEQKVGTPLVEGATVSVKVLGNVKGPKVIAFKKKRRKTFKNKKGHRQIHTEVLVESINF